MKKTLRLMIKIISVRNVVTLILSVILGIISYNIIYYGWGGIGHFSDDFIQVFLIAIGILFIGLYIYTKGKLDGILEGTSTERNIWREWYKNHQEEIEKHNIHFEKPTSSMLQCPHSDKHHD